MNPHKQPIRLGVLGLGRAFTLMIPTLSKDPRVALAACFDPNASATAAFAKAFVEAHVGTPYLREFIIRIDQYETS